MDAAHSHGARTLPDLIAQIANLVVSGAKPSTLHIAADKTWVRNHIPLKLSGWEVDLYQLPSAFLARKELRGKLVHTTTAYVRDVPDSQRAAAERVITDLCHLLTFATTSEVRPFAFKHGPIGRRWLATGVVSDFRSPIESHGDAISHFVGCCWPRYRTLKRSRKLPEFFHYLALSDLPGTPLEVNMLLAFVALENLKATWAHSKGFPYKRGRFTRPPTSPGGSASSKSLSFEELVTGMLAELGMSRRLKRIIRIRNQIVHLGVTTRSFKKNLEYYEQTRSLQHEYVLRLLGYTGEYLDYASLKERTL